MRIINTSTSTRFIGVILSVVIALIANTSSASMGMKTSDSQYVIEGYDVVSYFRDSGPLPGNTKFRAEHDNQTLLFSSIENLNDFKDSPDEYMPAFNGNCAYGIAFGMVSMSDPKIFDIVEGKLYLQLNAGVRNRWNRRPDGHIAKANRVWGKLQSAQASH